METIYCEQDSGGDGHEVLGEMGTWHIATAISFGGTPIEFRSPPQPNIPQILSMQGCLDDD